ncbi:MAG: L-2-amino-thiazoline-4-carboxylic acid hydrolase [Gammaproteobacteria bacterium]|nr:L-2-amino-thiazoline-4-carboxylic acid hydrolase [Gammaproteobacteria bacterium]
MPDQIAGYYRSRESQLVDKFDAHCELMKASLCERYGVDLASALRSDARQEYQRLILEIPYVKGIRARALNTFLLITAQELAVYKAMKRHGKSPQEAWELCHEALRLGVAKVPRWKRWLLRRLMFSKLMRKRFESLARERVRFGDFEVQYLVGGGSEFDLGVNYVQCGNHRFAVTHGGEEFAPYICMSDIALSDAMGWGLIRTQTLADGCDHCDFRFKKGAATQISSQTPDVQETIERIRNKEAKERVALHD